MVWIIILPFYPYSLQTTQNHLLRSPQQIPLRSADTYEHVLESIMVKLVEERSGPQYFIVLRADESLCLEVVWGVLVHFQPLGG